MSTSAMPFISGPVVPSATHLRLSPPRGSLATIVPLSKVQEVLWLDYIRRPWSTHYALTLKVDFSKSKIPLETIISYIHQLGVQNDLLRTTFHTDGNAQSISQSYMAVHDEAGCFQDIEIISEDSKLASALRRPFDLSIEFPVRWIIHQKFAYANGQLETAYTVYASGHHIAVDGSSMSYLSQKLLELNSGSVEEKTLALGPSYGEFVQRQNAYLKSEAASLAKSFWLSQVANTVPYEWSHVPSPKTAGKDYRQIDTWAFFSTEELTSWSKLYKTSWFRIATSVIGLVLAGHSTPTPHHDHTLQVAFGARESKFARCISHMANTMPIRQPVSELLQSDSTFADLVKNVGKRISQAKKHEMFPYISLLEAAKEEFGGESIKDKAVVTFSPKLADASCTLYPVQGVWDLFFCFLEQDDGVSLGVISDPTVFDDSAVEALRVDFMSTLRLSQESSAFPLNSLSYLQSRDVATLIEGPDMADVDAVNSLRVVDWIEKRALMQPDHIALSCGEEMTSMTYKELSQMSNSKALYLQQRGVGRADVVVLHVDRSFEIVTWILAIHKVGACYVVLDKGLPFARKQSILRVAEAKLFITDLVDTALFAECSTAPAVLNVWTETKFPAGRPEAVAGQQPSDLAYLIFTSGSTGTPKAIMVEQQNLSNYVSSTRNLIKVGPGSRVLQFATFAFDASILEWAVTLAYGATMCFVKHGSLLVGDYLADMLELNDVNFFHTTPSVLSSIPSCRSLPSLRMLSVGGEASSPALLDKWSRKLKLIHAYGPTETTVICSNEIMIPNGDKLPASSNIGLSNPNMNIVICPEDSEAALAQGEVGEICIIGPQVTRGYKNQPDLTAEKFRTIEWNGKTTRMYRSGDSGFLDSDGKLNIKGRLNNREIKLRGYRIDLAAVEKSILDHCPELVMASVQVVNDSLIGFVVPNKISGELIRERISKDLPAYSVPRQFKGLDSLPLNANGKVDHKQVLEQFGSERVQDLTEELEKPSIAVDTKMVDVTPSNDASNVARLEQSLASLWQDVLGLRELPSLDVSFYDAGGHSLLLTALHKKIVTRFPESGMSLLDVFYYPTIRAQAKYLAESVVSEAPSDASDISDRKSSTGQSQSSRSSVSGLLQDDKFAIVGMAGRFPGANTVEELWELLMGQKDGITTSDGAGAKKAELNQDEVFVPRYGSINGLEEFVGSEWAMSDEDASKLDPQKRLFLIVAKEALKDASIATSKTEGANVGTFVGIAHNTFQHSDSKGQSISDTFENRYKVVLDPNASTFTAFKLNLTGPSMDINAACASSLVAMHNAMNSLRSGDCEVALVGGASVSYPQLGGYATSEGKIFSISGECRPLDARSDGSVPSDSVAAVVLKPLTKAKEAGDRIYAVIEGHAIGTDGAVDKVGFTVPSSSGQAKVVRDAIVNSGVDPQAIRYVEMHGSGTSIGDALEVQGLDRAFSAAEAAFSGTNTPCTTGSSADSPISVSTPKDQEVLADGHKLLVGSNKGNFGNSETASGLISLIKASLSVHKGVVPPMRQMGEINNLIDLGKTRVQPLSSHLKLERGDHVGITALGYGGINAHCVIASLDTVENGN